MSTPYTSQGPFRFFLNHQDPFRLPHDPLALLYDLLTTRKDPLLALPALAFRIDDAPASG